MFGSDKIRTLVEDKLVAPQRNTAAIAITALIIASIALVVAARKGK